MDLPKSTIVVSGYVQTVGYRAFVKRKACLLNLKGLVRNDGTKYVEVFCDGPEERVMELYNFLNNKEIFADKDDPFGPHVESVKIYWEGENGYKGPWKKEYGDFTIDYGEEEYDLRDDVEAAKYLLYGLTGKYGVINKNIEKSNVKLAAIEGSTSILGSINNKLDSLPEKIADALEKKKRN